jgi:hypothetical protein
MPTEIVPSTEKEIFRKPSMKLYMKYNEGIESIGKNVFSHFSYYADVVESSASLTFRTHTRPDTFISTQIPSERSEKLHYR